jgi:hypothetical protein
VDLHLPTSNLVNYKSGSQRARVSTEPWGEANLYCAACDSPRISSLPTGTHAVDFSCPSCASRYQLKSSASKFGNRVIDGAYAAMHRAILSDQTPNLFFLHYKLPQLTVESVSPPPWTQGQLRSIHQHPAGARLLGLRQRLHALRDPCRNRNALPHRLFCIRHETSLHHSAPQCTKLKKTSRDKWNCALNRSMWSFSKLLCCIRHASAHGAEKSFPSDN